MKVIIKIYGRWSEDCNWQLDTVEEKELALDDLGDFREAMELLGYEYDEKYGEACIINASRLKMTMVKKAG